MQISILRLLMLSGECLPLLQSHYKWLWRQRAVLCQHFMITLVNADALPAQHASLQIVSSVTPSAYDPDDAGDDNKHEQEQKHVSSSTTSKSVPHM